MSEEPESPFRPPESEVDLSREKRREARKKLVGWWAIYSTLPFLLLISLQLVAIPHEVQLRSDPNLINGLFGGLLGVYGMMIGAALTCYSVLWKRLRGWKVWLVASLLHGLVWSLLFHAGFYGFQFFRYRNQVFTIAPNRWDLMIVLSLWASCSIFAMILLALVQWRLRRLEAKLIG